MKNLIALPVLALALAGCASWRTSEHIADGLPAALGETVHVGSLLASPRRVVEDSRCPVDVQCIQAGRLVVSTRLDGDGWQETVPLTLGEPHATHGTTVTLVSGRPEKRAERRTPRGEYRFVFDGG